MNPRDLLRDLDEAIDALGERRERELARVVLAEIASAHPVARARARELSGWLERAPKNELDWLASAMRELRFELMCQSARGRA